MASDSLAGLRFTRAHAAAGRLAQAHASLAEAGWEPQQVLACLPMLGRDLPLVPHRDQVGWIVRLRQLCQELDGRFGARDLAFELGALCAAVAHWLSASELFLQSLARSGEHPATHCNIGIAAWQLARHDTAEKHLALAADAAPERYRAQLASLRAWRSACPALPGSEAGIIGITPLGAHHADTLLRRQLSGDALDRAGLNHYVDRQAAQRWIDEQAALPGKSSFAVIHAHYGLIGGIALRRCAAKAHFHYWISEDFQRQGHGARALELLSGVARQQGIGTLYSPVLERNGQSLRALRRAGYRSLPGKRTATGESTRICCLKLPAPLHPTSQGSLP